MLVSDGCLVRTPAVEGTSLEPPPAPSSMDTTGLFVILEAVSLRWPQQSMLEAKIFHFGSVLLLMAVMRLDLSVSSWWRPSRGTTSLPTTIDVTNSFVNSAAGKLKSVFIKRTSRLLSFCNSNFTLIILQEANKRNNEHEDTRDGGAMPK